MVGFLEHVARQAVVIVPRVDRDVEFDVVRLPLAQVRLLLFIQAVRRQELGRPEVEPQRVYEHLLLLAVQLTNDTVGLELILEGLRQLHRSVLEPEPQRV